MITQTERNYLLLLQLKYIDYSIAMKKLLFTSLMIFFIGFAVSALSFSGKWEGTLKAGLVKLRLVFNIQESQDGTLSATLDSPNQGATDIPCEATRVPGNDKIEINVPLYHAKFTGALNNGKIEGTFSQNGLNLPLTMEKVETISPYEIIDNYHFNKNNLLFKEFIFAGDKISAFLHIKMIKLPGNNNDIENNMEKNKPEILRNASIQIANVTYNFQIKQNKDLYLNEDRTSKKYSFKEVLLQNETYFLKCNNLGLYDQLSWSQFKFPDKNTLFIILMKMLNLIILILI